MFGAALAVIAAAVGARAVYPALLQIRAARRRRLGPDGVVRGAAPITLHRAGAPAVLLLHGGGDTPQVMAELARFLHDTGYSVRAPLLASHGRSLDALLEVSASSLFDEVKSEYDALRREHPSVSVVGLSMGGALGVRLAAEHDQDMRSLVLLAPYLDMPHFARRLAETSDYWRWLVPYFPSGGGQSIHDRAAAARALGHGILTPAALRAFYDTMSAASAALTRVRAPTLVVQSREDNRISAESAELAFGRLGATDKKLVWIDGAGHVITVDFGHDRVFRHVAGWLETH